MIKFRKKLIIIYILLFTAIIVFNGCYFDDNAIAENTTKNTTNTTVVRNTTNTTMQNTTEKPAPRKFQIGEQIDQGDAIITVNGVRTIPETTGLYSTRKEGYKILFVDVTIINNNKLELDLYPKDFTVTDLEDLEMERVYTTAENGNLLGAAFLDRPLRGEASFLVPEDSTNAILNVKTGLSNFDKVELNF